MSTSDALSAPVAKIAAVATDANTKTIGYLGLFLVLASYVVPAIAPDIDNYLKTHGFPPIIVHGGIALIGGICALLGRWKTFDPDSP